MDPKPELKLYSFYTSLMGEGIPDTPILTIAENKDQAVMDFFLSEQIEHIFFDEQKLPTQIIWYGYDHRSELDKQGIVEETLWIKPCQLAYPMLPSECYPRVGRWVIEQWGIDLGDVELFKTELCDDELQFSDGVLEIIRTKILELPPEKQVSIAQFMNDGFLIKGRIEEIPMSEAFVMNRLSKRHEDEMNQMRVDTAKVMRRNVPPELFEIVAGHLKS